MIKAKVLSEKEIAATQGLLDLPFKTEEGCFMLPIPINDVQKTKEEETLSLLIDGKREFYLPPMRIPEEIVPALLPPVPLFQELRVERKEMTKSATEKCGCSLSKNAVSTCLPEQFFQPGNLAVIALGLSGEELGISSPKSPTYLDGVSLGEFHSKLCVLNDYGKSAINIPTRNLFLLRKQIKVTFFLKASKHGFLSSFFILKCKRPTSQRCSTHLPSSTRSTAGLRQPPSTTKGSSVPSKIGTSASYWPSSRTTRSLSSTSPFSSTPKGKSLSA